ECTPVDGRWSTKCTTEYGHIVQGPAVRPTANPAPPPGHLTRVSALHDGVVWTVRSGRSMRRLQILSQLPVPRRVRGAFLLDSQASITYPPLVTRGDECSSV